MTNIQELRDLMLETLNRLKDGEIEMGEAATMAKVGDTVMGTVRLQMDYARSHQQNATIDFLQDVHKGKTIDITPPKAQIEYKPKLIKKY